MEGFLAIDLETANAQRASACALGWAQFADGELVDSGAFLIDPCIPDEEWDGFNIYLHGIRPSDVRGAPSFGEVWEWLAPHGAVGPLVAHNAAFDMSVLRAELGRASVVPDAFRYLCSARLARAVWPEMLSVSLPIVADELELDLDHHDPRSDATASGHVLVAAVRACGAASIGDAMHQTGCRWGQVDPDLSWAPCGLPRVRLQDLKAQTDQFDHDHPLRGRVVVFTGTLDTMVRRDAFQAVLNVGGQPGTGVTKATNMLVVGEQDITKLAAGQTMSSKLRKATAFRGKGMDIELIGEADFLRLL